MGAKEGGKRETKQAKQPINHLGRSRAGPGGGRACGGRKGEQRGQRGPAVSACFILLSISAATAAPCIDYDLGPAHMFGAVIRRGLPAQLLRWTSNFKLTPPDFGFPSPSSARSAKSSAVVAVRFPDSPEIDVSEKEEK